MIDGYIYGSNWLNNADGNWCCIDWETGKKKWEEHWQCKGSVIAADKMLYLYDEKKGTVVTLEMAINECRVANGEKPLEYKGGDIAKISAYMAFISRGKPVDVKVESEGAYKAYMKGKEFFYAKRGQLNMSCAN